MQFAALFRIARSLKPPPALLNKISILCSLLLFLPKRVSAIIGEILHFIGSEPSVLEMILRNLSSAGKSDRFKVTTCQFSDSIFRVNANPIPLLAPVITAICSRWFLLNAYPPSFRILSVTCAHQSESGRRISLPWALPLWLISTAERQSSSSKVFATES